MPVHLRLQRAPALILDNGHEVALSDNDAALLMLVARRGALERAWVATLLWPQDAKAALVSLRQRDYRLGKAAGRPLLAKRGRLTLLEDVAHDLGDPGAALARDVDAVDTALLPGLVYAGRPALHDEIEVERTRWRDAVVRALARLAHEREDGGRIDEALGYAQRWAREEEASESAARQLMRLHHRRGDRALALQVFETLKQRLHEQLHEPPSDDLVVLAQQIAATEVPAAPRVRELPERLRHPPRTVGHAELLAVMQRRLSDARAVLLTGPAGIGKTRVFDELVQRSGPALVCRLGAGDSGVPLALARRLARAVLALDTGDGGHAEVLHRLAGDSGHAEVLHRLAGDGTAAAGPLATPRLQRALEAALDRLGGAGVMTIGVEDLHFADEASVALLVQLVGHGRRAWLMTCRDLEVPAPLLAWLADQPADDEAQFRVGALAAADAAELVAAVHPQAVDVESWARRLGEHCGGHPLHMLQVLRALHDAGGLDAAPPAALPVPREAMQRVARLLDRVDERAQQLAFAAALCAGHFGVALAQRLLKCSATELAVPWRRLQALGLLREGGFTHELVRQAVLDALPHELAPAMHAEIAVALRDTGVLAARRVPHWKAAAAWPDAARDLAAAADEALAMGLRTAARSMLVEAAELYRLGGLDDEAFDAAARAVPLTLSLLSSQEARSEAAALAARARTEHQRCRALILQAPALTEAHDSGGAAHAREARALARRLGDPVLQANAAQRESLALHVAGDAAAALAELQDALALQQHLEPADRRELTDSHAILLAATGRRHAAAAHWLKELERARGESDLARTAELAGHAAIQLGYLCQTERALEMAELALSLNEQLQAEGGFAAVDLYSVAALCADCGRYERALQLGERGVAALREAGLPHLLVSAENTLAATFLLLGRNDLAQKLLADAPPHAPLWARALRRAAQGQLERARGRSPLAATQQARRMLDESGAMASPYAYWRIELELARWSAPGQTVDRAAACLQWARQHEHVALSRQAGFVLVEGLTRAGRHAEAADAADTLVAECGNVDAAFNFHLPELWWALVQAFDNVAATGRADALAHHAARWIESCAAAHVPPLFRDGFLRVNAVNHALLRRAAATGLRQAAD